MERTQTTVADIQTKMETGGLSPHDYADIRVILSGKYSRTSAQLEEVLMQKPEVWMKMRENNKSDTSTDREFQASEIGKIETKCRLRMKRIDKMTGACSSALRVAENELKNIC